MPGTLQSYSTVCTYCGCVLCHDLTLGSQFPHLQYGRIELTRSTCRESEWRGPESKTCWLNVWNEWKPQESAGFLAGTGEDPASGLLRGA